MREAQEASKKVEITVKTPLRDMIICLKWWAQSQRHNGKVVAIAIKAK